MPKIAVITALSGTRERLYDPKIVFPGVDYFAFVDSPQNVTIWNQLPLLDFTFDQKYKNRRNAKPYKIAPHLFVPNYDFYIWHDVSHELVTDPFKVVDKYLVDKDIALFKHTQRNCLYEEAKILKELGYDTNENIDRQISYYREQGMPENFGLYELPVSIRKNTPKIQTMNLAWWEQICRYSSRDQISLPYLLFKMDIKVEVLPGYANRLQCYRKYW
jgi:hypothetical protein